MQVAPNTAQLFLLFILFRYVLILDRWIFVNEQWNEKTDSIWRQHVEPNRCIVFVL